MRRHGPVIAHCTDSQDFPLNANLNPNPTYPTNPTDLTITLTPNPSHYST